MSNASHQHSHDHSHDNHDHDHDHDHDHHGDHDHPHDHDHSNDHDHNGWRARLRHALTPHSHDAADSLDSALESSARGIRAVKISLAALAITAVLQLVIVYFSGSVALLADTIHNFSDALTAIPLWIAFHLSRRAANRRYTYGYGRAEDIAGLFVVAMIALSAIVAAWQAVERLLNPSPIHNVGWVAAAGVIGFVGNELVALFRIREGKTIGSAALVADGYHARADGITSLAVVAGATGVALGWGWADPVIGLAITVAILLVLRTAARDVLHRLMDAIDPALIDDAERALADLAGVASVGRIRMRWIGHELHADAEVEIDPATPLAEASAIAHVAERALMAGVPRLRSALVYARSTSPTHET